MARVVSAKRPKNMAYTVKRLLSYMGRHKFSLLSVAILVTISVLCNLLGTYMIRPVINTIAAGEGMDGLIKGVTVTAVIYVIGVLAAIGYTQIMARSAQKVVYDIRKDLFNHMQSLPLNFFDSRQSGDIMSYYTNDVDMLRQLIAQVIPHALVQGTILTCVFFITYLLVLFVCSSVLLFHGIDFLTSFSAVLTCLSNTGPGFGRVGAVDNFGWMPEDVKVLLSFCMLAGRLEFYALLILLHPSLWKK